MKTLSKISLGLLAIATLTASTEFAQGYDWRQKVTYGNDPTRGYARTYRTYRTYSTAATQPQEESRRAYSYEPAASAPFKAGDTIVVAAATANLKIADRVVATVSRGRRITVSSVEGPWVGTNIEENGRNVGGWILASDLAPGAPARNACR